MEQKKNNPKLTHFLRYESCTTGLRFEKFPEIFADRFFELFQDIANFLHPVNGKRDFLNDHNRELRDRWLNTFLRQLYILIKNYLNAVDNKPVDYT